MPVPPGGRTLVAGIGNVFLGDDGFGAEVARRMAMQPVAGNVRVADFGIRGMHLAYEILGGGYAQTILVDAMPRGGAPGTLYVLDPEVVATDAPPDAHAMHPHAVLQLVAQLGGTAGRVVIVGCEPQPESDEPMTLSAPVAHAVDQAIALIRRLVAEGAAPVPEAAPVTEEV